ALVIISTEENFKDEKLARLSYDNAAGDAGLPVVVISRQAAFKILHQDGLPQLAALERKLIERLKPVAVNPRPDAQSENHLGNAVDIVDILGLPTKSETLSLTTDVLHRNVPAHNVIGILEGSDPVLKSEAVIIGAHYDHLGRGGEGSLAEREGDIHHGADDNASGVAGVIELARIFSAAQPRMKRTLVFIAFGGEEEGLLGSNYYVNHPIWPLDKTVAMINMDMIGRMKEGRLMIGGVGTAKEWREMISAANVARGMNVTAAGSPTREQSNGRAQTKGAPVVVAANGQTVVSFDSTKQFSLTLNEDGYGPSDHSSFYAKQVPVLFFFTGTHDDYHKPSDTADKINYDDEARILSFVASLVRSIDAGTERPTYTVAKSQAQGRTMGFRVYLGTIPNYADSNDGLKLDGVREDSPAAKAGLRAGDRIVKLAGREVRNVYDYTYALGEMKAGQEYEVDIVRGTEALRLKITPTERK
ncbi:MAG TPA: M20/M25/M40 family metallo-hydrolase, partial [Pyrinomonadaceae bacterium]|nr:M20/M25/M40 family metallo-hydrolase [Pyrinomonadaceae bacterium]